MLSRATYRDVCNSHAEVLPGHTHTGTRGGETAKRLGYGILAYWGFNLGSLADGGQEAGQPANAGTYLTKQRTRSLFLQVILVLRGIFVRIDSGLTGCSPFRVQS